MTYVFDVILTKRGDYSSRYDIMFLSINIYPKRSD